jgi:hypothetical protein
LNSSEVEALAFHRLRGDEQGLLGYYTFNQEDFSLITDHSFNGNHGEMIGEPALDWEFLEDDDTKPMYLHPCH